MVNLCCLDVPQVLVGLVLLIVLLVPYLPSHLDDQQVLHYRMLQQVPVCPAFPWLLSNQVVLKCSYTTPVNFLTATELDLTYKR